ncbi:PREDICTED: putative protein TPRXL [Ipomoea nil]|uniref:putative protein TPRXL n=1 Tax=Ipomoea nil TaxID=35883 RepID=UPI000900E2A2|nr:PREDICTED: putative protein TPRXL [Ipomoea nil]
MMNSTVINGSKANSVNKRSLPVNAQHSVLEALFGETTAKKRRTVISSSSDSAAYSSSSGSGSGSSYSDSASSSSPSASSSSPSFSSSPSPSISAYLAGKIDTAAMFFSVIAISGGTSLDASILHVRVLWELVNFLGFVFFGSL